MTPSTENVIELVQKYPVLYDTSHCDYKNKKIKKKIWDNIAEILGDCDGDTLRKQWKNLRDAYSKHLRSRKTNTGQAAKLIERYKTWPWAALMSFLRPHLKFAETNSNKQRSSEEAGSSQSTTQWNAEELASSQSTKTPINTAQFQSNGLSQSQQDDTPQLHSRRKRSSVSKSQSQVDKVINFMSKKTEKDDDTDLLFKSYAKKLKKMSRRRQATVKFEIAKIMLKAELEEADEMQFRSNAEGHQENSIVKIAQSPASSDGSDT